MKIHMGILMLVGALTAPQAVHAGPKSIVPPAVPDGLELSPDEFTPFLVAHAVGTQGYVCVAVSGVYSWKPFGPQATLFDEQGGQVMTHFLSPRPYDQLLSPTWQHSRDTSIVWGEVLKISSDANYVAPNAIPWLPDSKPTARTFAPWRSACSAPRRKPMMRCRKRGCASTGRTRRRSTIWAAG